MAADAFIATCRNGPLQKTAGLFVLLDFPSAGDFAALQRSAGNRTSASSSYPAKITRFVTRRKMGRRGSRAIRVIWSVWSVATANENACGDCAGFVRDSNVSSLDGAPNANDHFFFGISAQCSRTSNANYMRLILNCCALVHPGLIGCGARLSAEDRREAEEHRHVPEQFRERLQKQ
ncbi:MAG: hypothetical protein C5B58_10675 [Acidobacteria bacterium]|nr:MAG: hypothetical protein C5B58_10675 [Acidobacteriota bacterium]